MGLKEKTGLNSSLLVSLLSEVGCAELAHIPVGITAFPAMMDGKSLNREPEENLLLLKLPVRNLVTVK